jgi:hypothetical protein
VPVASIVVRLAVVVWMVLPGGLNDSVQLFRSTASLFTSPLRTSISAQHTLTDQNSSVVGPVWLNIVDIIKLSVSWYVCYWKAKSNLPTATTSPWAYKGTNMRMNGI